MSGGHQNYETNVFFDTLRNPIAQRAQHLHKYLMFPIHTGLHRVNDSKMTKKTIMLKSHLPEATKLYFQKIAKLENSKKSKISKIDKMFFPNTPGNRNLDII